MEEIYIIKKICDGDIESFSFFVKKYKDMAYSLAMSIIKDEYKAEEAVQDSFIKAFRNLKSFNQKSKFSTWFYRIVVNESYSTFNRIQRDILQFHHEYDNEVIDEDDIVTVQQENQIQMINKALERIPSNESLALRIFYLEEESIRALCNITGWSESNAKVILHRGRKNMLRILKQVNKS